MSKTAHTIFLASMVILVLTSFIFLTANGLDYYRTAISERNLHAEHYNLKPSGKIGHGLGIIGTMFILFGVGGYMARKRYRFLSRVGVLKHWLEFHIFLCTLGPLLVLYHTAFKFGGLVAVSFWSMVAVFLSGIAGRFIYLQIPRSIEGRELSLNEVRSLKSNLTDLLKSSYDLDENDYNIIADSVMKKTSVYHKSLVTRYISNRMEDRKSVNDVKQVLRKQNLPRNEYIKILGLVKSDIRINRRIDRLAMMQNLFRYWHVAHLPFALVMLIIMVIHVTITILFGYRWIF